MEGLFVRCFFFVTTVALPIQRRYDDVCTIEGNTGTLTSSSVLLLRMLPLLLVFVGAKRFGRRLGSGQPQYRGATLVCCFVNSGGLTYTRYTLYTLYTLLVPCLRQRCAIVSLSLPCLLVLTLLTLLTYHTALVLFIAFDSF